MDHTAAIQSIREMLQANGLPADEFSDEQVVALRNGFWGLPSEVLEIIKSPSVMKIGDFLHIYAASDPKTTTIVATVDQHGNRRTTLQERGRQ